MKKGTADPFTNEQLRKQIEDLRLQGFALMAMIRATGLNTSSAYKWHKGQFDYTDEALERIKHYLSHRKE